MADTDFTQESLNGFREAVQSLKLYRRADLLDENGTDLIDELYVDPLPSDQVLKNILDTNTTFVIGRKGTGKSTIFQRLQSELRKRKHQTSAYIDIKTVYESSQVDPDTLVKLNMSGMASHQSVAKLLLYREFIRSVINEIKSEIGKRLASSWWAQIKERFTGSAAELFEELDELITESDSKFTNISDIKVVERKQLNSLEQKSGFESSIVSKFSAAPNVVAKFGEEKNNSQSTESHNEFTEVLLRVVNIRGLVERIKVLLTKLGIRNLYVLVDDFSELPEEAMKVVVDVLLAPLNNWSDEFVKFKIAAYPGRIYLGQIDKTKIDEIYLDLYKLYGSSDVVKMEEDGTDFTFRLVESRVRHHCGLAANDFFEGDLSEIWRQLFFASMANPRILGYLLHFAYEGRLISGKKINLSAIHDASKRFYEEKIESYFSMGRFLHESFAERASIFSLKELVESIVTRAKDLKKHESNVIKKITGRPPTSHFHVPVEYEPLFSTLELNFFITKYFEMSDRSARKVTVYALNYGLCNKYNIGYGRPLGEREFRLYFVERFFDYTALVTAFLESNQEIVCESCGYRYSYENLPALQFYKMKCRECSAGSVRVENLSRKYSEELSAVNDNLLLPQTELGILQTLHVESEPLRAAHIAAELDCSYQLIGKRAKWLADKGLVKRYMLQNNRVFEIESAAENIYFSPDDVVELEIPPESNE
ncbi:hypothetical protein [Lacunimicrobium album]